MTMPTARAFIALACMLLVGGNAVAEPMRATPAQSAGPGLFLSTDSEGFTTRRFSAEYLRELDAGGNSRSSLGVRYRAHQFTQADQTRNARQLAIAGKGEIGKSSANWQAEAGVMRQGGRGLLTLDANLHAPLNKKTSMEAFINRDYVETMAALDRGIHATFAGASIEHQLNEHLAVVGMAGQQRFSDGNRRKHARLRLIWQPDLDRGLTLQLRHRFYSSGMGDSPGAYFNPDRYRESLFLVGWRKRGKEWNSNVVAGAGRQYVGEASSTPTAMLEASLDKNLSRNQNLSLRAGYNRSASFGGPDYRYRYLQANWNVRF